MVRTMESVYRSYYTKSDALVRYMISKLDIKPGNHILEPCAGEGVFVDAILNAVGDVAVDVYDLNPEAITTMCGKYGGDERVGIHCSDTLTDADLSLKCGFENGYDRVIGNPPYGGWLDYGKRGALKKRFEGAYARETYGLFLLRGVDLLRRGGRLVFIVPDTFLHLHLHTPLRIRLLSKCHIEEIAVFPSHFFPGVRFSYSKMCIVTLVRNTTPMSGEDTVIRVLSNLKTPESLLIDAAHERKVRLVNQSQMIANVDHALFITDESQVSDLINTCQCRIGAIASCVTGLYTGADTRFLRPAHSAVRSATRYPTIDDSMICRDYIRHQHLLDGLKTSPHFIPIMKGGRRRYFKPDEWYVDWSVHAVQTYRSNHKARFQNPDYYFRHGIGVPMVSSSSISAAILKDRVFDQSVVGIFPQEEKWLYYLLAFFNTETCNTLIRTINPTANNSANYIKKIPLLLPDDATLNIINSTTRQLLESARATGTIDETLRESVEVKIRNMYGF